MNASLPGYTFMPLSSVQKGAIGQFAFLAIALATGNGEVEVYIPAADNEGRDAEIRRHLKNRPGISIQAKIAFWINVHRRGEKFLRIRVSVPKHRMQKDPRLWFLLAYYDIAQLGFCDPLFLIPAKDFFEKFGTHVDKRGWVLVDIEASMAPNSHDRCSPYRVAAKDLGKRLLQIIDDTPLTATAALARLPVDGVWLSRVMPTAVGKSQTTSVDRTYRLIRKAVLERDSLSGWYQGHRRLLSPFLLGTKAGDPHVLGYQFDGTSEKPLAPEGSPENWRCLRVAELTKVKALPGIWHAVPKGKGFQHCIDQVDVSAYRPAPGKRHLRRAA